MDGAVNQPQGETERSAIKTEPEARPSLGRHGWTQTIASRLDLGHTMRDEGRPKKDAWKKN
jgi:hypothetical protein